MRMIDGDALIEALLEARHEETETTLKLIRFIEKQPGLVGTEMSLPKRGRWIEGADGCVFCSECGIEWLSDSAKYYKYCPICGARMEASDD